MTATPSVTTAVAAPALPRIDLRPSPSKSSRSWRAFGAIVALIAVVALLVTAWVCGMRWFVVQTPSMARTAPVGTLVVTAPLTAQAHIGDVVAFEPPGLARVYTHRVVAVFRNGSIRTRGDLNTAADGWITPPDRILGYAVMVVPGLGYLIESLPALLIGGVALFLITRLLRRGEHRSAARVLGAHLLVAVIIALRHPFVAMTVVALQTTGKHENALVVSTGILPIQVSAGGRTLTHLVDGQLASIPISDLSTVHAAVHASLDLGWWAYGCLLAVTLLPSACFLVVSGRASTTQGITHR